MTVMQQFEDTIGQLNPTTRGLAVSLVMLAGGVSSIFAGQAADRFGHLRIIAFGAPSSCSGPSSKRLRIIYRPSC